MGYFRTIAEAARLDEQCSRCVHQFLPCPIYFVQTEFNNDAYGNPTARAILDELVTDAGTCKVYVLFDLKKAKD